MSERRFKTHKWRLTGGSTAFRRWRWRCDNCGVVVWKTRDEHHPLGLRCGMRLPSGSSVSGGTSNAD